MATPLHDADALAAVAETAEGAARHWSEGLLALYAPSRLPQDSTFTRGEPAAVRGDPTVIGHLLAAMERGDGALAALAAVGAGAFPDPQAAGRAALAGMDVARGTIAAVLGDVVATTGVTTPKALAVAARHLRPESRWLVGVMALQLSDDDALADTASAVAAELDVPDEHGITSALAALGVPPVVDPPGIDPEILVAAAAEQTGSAMPLLRKRGSRRRRAQAWIGELVADDVGPVPALLRAWAAEDRHHGLLFVAAWWNTFAATDALIDLGRGRGDATTLRAARAMAISTPERALAHAAEAHGVPPALGLIGTAHAERAALAIVHLAADGADIPPAVVAAVAPELADHLPALLADRSTRDAALRAACAAPTEAVLAALLALPIPADPSPRRGFALALASMGDLAAVPALRDLRTVDAAAAAPAIALAEAILRTTI